MRYAGNARDFAVTEKSAQEFALWALRRVKPGAAPAAATAAARAVSVRVLGEVGALSWRSGERGCGVHGVAPAQADGDDDNQSTLSASQGSAIVARGVTRGGPPSVGSLERSVAGRDGAWR